nr:MAG TPA: hypothetical protein [Caudoviricetes sp.]DAY42222.1 MAG TPA: hypothetical protein [Caudoviricetes sp.]
MFFNILIIYRNNIIYYSINLSFIKYSFIIKFY